MNFVDLSIQFQAEVTEENPNAAFNPAERPNHPHLEAMQVILYSRPSGVVVRKQAGMVQDALRKALETIERYRPEEWEKGKKHFRPRVISDMQADDLMDMGVLLGEVYDEKIIEECLHMGRNPINEVLVNLN